MKHAVELLKGNHSQQREAFVLLSDLQGHVESEFLLADAMKTVSERKNKEPRPPVVIAEVLALVTQKRNSSLRVAHNSALECSNLRVTL